MTEPAPEVVPPQDDPVGDVLLAWAIAAGLSALAWRLPVEAARPIVGAAVWPIVPVAFLIYRKRSLHTLGLLPKRPLKTLLWTGAAALLLPAFGVGYLLWFGLEHWEAPRLGVLGSAFLYHLLRAGVPEEIFFRGFAQPLLCERFPDREGSTPRIRNLRAIALAAALFALTHAVYLENPFTLFGVWRLMTFFPGLLFGALREKTGDLWGSVILHALSNAWLVFLVAGYGG